MPSQPTPYLLIVGIVLFIIIGAFVKQSYRETVSELDYYLSNQH